MNFYWKSGHGYVSLLSIQEKMIVHYGSLESDDGFNVRGSGFNSEFLIECKNDVGYHLKEFNMISDTEFICVGNILDVMLNIVRCIEKCVKSRK
jgi:hypothetical protein